MYVVVGSSVYVLTNKTHNRTNELDGMETIMTKRNLAFLCFTLFPTRILTGYPRHYVSETSHERL